MGDEEFVPDSTRQETEPCLTGSSTASSECNCGTGTGFCRIHGYYGEGQDSYRSGSPISWQHFPRSTSSRSHCDDSSMEPTPGPSLPDISCKPEGEEEETELSVASSTVYPIVKSIAQLKAEHYLKIRHVCEFFNFLIGHLICAEPDDPIQYLMEILVRCLNFRDCYGEEPLLVSKYHIKSLYNSFDPYGKGSITIDQYEVAMDSIGLSKGLTQPNRNPPRNQNGKIEEEVFLGEALRCLRENLRLMIRIPKDWEENRLVWRRVMMRRCQKVMQYNSAEEQLGENSFKASSGSCECEVVEEDVCRGTCPCPPKLRHEPEQLFLTS